MLPEVLAQFRRRLDEPLMAELLAVQAATAMEDGLVSPAHLVVDTFPSEQGSQRVNDAATLYKAPKKSSKGLTSITAPCATQARRCRRTRSNCSTTFNRLCAASAVSAGGWGKCL